MDTYIYSDGELLTAEKLNQTVNQLASAIEQLMENKVCINGTWFETSGSIKAPGSWAYIKLDGVNVATATVPDPFTPPSGYRFNYTIEETSGYTFLSVARRESNYTQIRLLQVGSIATASLNRLRWYLVKA